MMVKKPRLPDDWRELLEQRGVLEPPAIPTLEKLGDAITDRKGLFTVGTGLDKVARAKVGLPGPDGMVYGELEKIDRAEALCGAFVIALRQVPVQSLLPETRPMDDLPHMDVTYGKDADDQGDQRIDVEYAELPESSTFEGESWEAPPEPTTFDPMPDHAALWLDTQIPMGVTYIGESTMWEDDGLVDHPAHWLLHVGYAYDPEYGTVYPLATVDEVAAAAVLAWADGVPHHIIEPTAADRDLWQTPAFVPPMVAIEDEGEEERSYIYWLDSRYTYNREYEGDYGATGDGSTIADAEGHTVWSSWTRGGAPSDDASSRDAEAQPGDVASGDDGAAADDPGAAQEAERQADIIARANAAGYHLTLDPVTRQAMDDTTGVPVPWRFLEKNFGNHPDAAAESADVPVIDKPKRKRSRGKPKDDVLARGGSVPSSQMDNYEDSLTATQRSADELAKQGLPPKLSTVDSTIGVEVTTGDEPELDTTAAEWTGEEPDGET